MAGKIIAHQGIHFPTLLLRVGLYWLLLASPFTLHAQNPVRGIKFDPTFSWVREM